MESCVNHPIETKLSDKGSNLYIFFGGIAAGIAMPPFEFYKAAEILDEHKIFIRDFKQNWYQTGLPSITKDAHSTALLISKKIEDIKPNKVYFVGNSMGGYAAILFAHLIGKGEVIAFAPQTFISPKLRLKHNDYRWLKQIFNTYLKCLFKPKVFDLKALTNARESNVKVSIFVSKSDALDFIHAEHLNGTKGVVIHTFDSGGHGVVKLLRDDGKLPEIMLGKYT